MTGVVRVDTHHHRGEGPTNLSDKEESHDESQRPAVDNRPEGFCDEETFDPYRAVVWHLYRDTNASPDQVRGMSRRLLN